MLIALPKGAILSGITTWAGTLARGLAGLGHRVMVLVHEVPGVMGAGPLAGLPGECGVEVRLLGRMPRIDEAVGEPRPELGAYQSAVEELHRAMGGPVVAVPTYSAECFGLFAAVSRALPGVVRTVGWMHSDIPYDRLTLRHYGAMIHRFVGVSSEMAAGLRAAMEAEGRAGDVVRIPYGVPIPASAARRESGRVVRLVYSGRMDREQKRVHALVEMCRELERLGVEHELTLVGDGPGAGEVDQLIAGASRVRRVVAGTGGVAASLDDADVFVLASRYEGLSVSMLEAMAHGCVPVVTRVSGAADAVGESASESCGVIVDAGPGVDEPRLGALMAAGVVEAVRRGIGALSVRARDRAAARFSDMGMASAVSALCGACAAEPARDWGPGRPTVAGDFTVPGDACERAARVLAGLRGRRVALWGAGRHTLAVARSSVGGATEVVAVIDDGAIAPGARVGAWAVVPASGAANLGVTDIVISSALHEEALWARRGEFERRGVRVHRLYGGALDEAEEPLGAARG